MIVLGNYNFYNPTTDAPRMNVKNHDAKVFDKSTFAEVLEQRKGGCPYSAMARDGIIEYNGVVFNCDYEHNAITLGDMSDPNKVLNISLPSGGTLRINVDNFDDIRKCAGMFTPEDYAAILRKIYEYNHCKLKEQEVEQDETEVIDGIVLSAQENTDNPGKAISDYKNELLRKILNNETEKKFQIGGQELSIKEWDKMMEAFDDAEKSIAEELEEEIRHMEELEENKKMA